MILSMTGFGRARVSAKGVTGDAEIRSVNHRYFKLKVVAPSALATVVLANRERNEHAPRRQPIRAARRHQKPHDRAMHALRRREKGAVHPQCAVVETHHDRPVARQCQRAHPAQPHRLQLRKQFRAGARRVRELDRQLLRVTRRLRRTQAAQAADQRAKAHECNDTKSPASALHS